MAVAAIGITMSTQAKGETMRTRMMAVAAEGATDVQMAPLLNSSKVSHNSG